MNRLPSKKRALVLRCLVEGMSIRSAARTTDVSAPTISSLLVKAGNVCTAYMDKSMRDLPCRRLQCDEIWAFVYAKDKRLMNVSLMAPSIAGTVWTWVAMCADTKLVPTWIIGDRRFESARELMLDLQPRLKHRIQLTTDGHSAYQEAVELAFGANVDYAQIVKSYSSLGKADGEERNGVQPAGNVQDFIRKDVLNGNPADVAISTSFIERQNLTMRMGMRRFTRRTNGFSKRVENHAHAVALHFMYYNFVRIHQTLRITPAMAAGVADTVWEVDDIVSLIAEGEPKSYGPRGPYRKTRKRKKSESARMKYLIETMERELGSPPPGEQKIAISESLRMHPRPPPKPGPRRIGPPRPPRAGWKGTRRPAGPPTEFLKRIGKL